MEIQDYVKEKVVKARVRQRKKRRTRRRTQADSRNTKGLLSPRSSGHRESEINYSFTREPEMPFS